MKKILLTTIMSLVVTALLIAALVGIGWLINFGWLHANGFMILFMGSTMIVFVGILLLNIVLFSYEFINEKIR